MAKKLIGEGHQVTMVCGSYSGGKTGLDMPFTDGMRRGEVDGIDVIEFELPYANVQSFLERTKTFLSFAWKSVRLVFREDYDLVFATTTPLTAGIPGIFARWLRGKPFVFEVRDLWPELPREMGVIKNPVILALMSVLEWVSYKSAHRLVGLSPGIVEGILRYKKDPSRVKMIPNGCDIHIFRGDVGPWRPEGVNEKDLLAVYTGTHGIANGLDAVLDAACELKKRGRDDIKLFLMGQGKLKGELQKAAGDKGLSNVIFHDPVDKKKLAGLMAGADIGMQILANVPAFYYGTSPNKFFDYLSAGLPVLTNYPGWVADLVRENGCGYAVEPARPVDFANALEKAADNRDGLVSMGDASAKLAERMFSRDDLAGQFVEWLEGTCK